MLLLITLQSQNSRLSENPDLMDKTSMEVFDAVVEDAGDTARHFQLSIEEFQLEEEPEFEFEI